VSRDARAAGSEGAASEPRSPVVPEPERAAALGKIGRFTVLRKLGQGGMGVVYVGLDERLGREVAIKLLRARKGELDQARLVREAQVMARLSHPNVVRIYEIGDEDGAPFIVMELVDGITLKQWLKQAVRSQAKILAIFDAAGRGLTAAHAKGLVHRDFKPDNVMIADDGRVLVMDFGLARSNAATAESKEDLAERERVGHGPLTNLTVTGHIVGTPAYMAPEQLGARRVDARTDQFAFCIALWEALYGRRPFAEDNLMVRARAVMDGALLVPRGARVPRWLRRALERGLTVDPEQRWPSMPALLEALRLRPRRPRAATLALGLVSAVALVVVLARELREPRERASDAQSVLAEPSAGNDAALVEQGTRTDDGTSMAGGTSAAGSTSTDGGTNTESPTTTGPEGDRAPQGLSDDEPARKSSARSPTTCKFTLPTAMGSTLSNRGPERPPCVRLRSQVTVLGSTDREVRLRVHGAVLALEPDRPRTTKTPRACWLVRGALDASYLALSVELDSTKCSG
jgi:serine/threonine protein kinase